MKNISSFILMLLLLFISCAKSQSIDCKKVHTGNFELNSKVSGKTKIVRTEKYQFETNEFMNVKSRYDIVWIDDCHYELRNRTLLSGTDKYNGEPTDIFKIEIVKIEGSKIFVKTGANFAKEVYDGEIDIVK
jgi:hypothetical protein